MPVVKGDIVAVHHNQLPNVWLQYQPPRFGVVEDAAGIDVVWEDGLFEQGINRHESLDVIRDPSAGAISMEGKVVRLDINPTASIRPSPAFDAVVIRRFRRETGGNGSVSANRLLVRLRNGAYMEVWASQATVLDDR